MNPHIEWETLELHPGPKNNDWFWALGIIAGTIAILAFVFNNIIFGIFVIIAAFSLGLMINARPKAQYLAITKEGMVVEDRLYAYDNLSHFYIEDFRDVENAHPLLRSKILIRTKSIMYPVLYIPIHEEIELEKIRSLLSKHIPEKKISEPLLVKLFKRYILS